MKTTYSWGFDFGLKWFGEAVQEKSESGIYFPVKESWFVPAELAQRGPATKSGTPASKHRAWKVREARKAREEWLEQIWHEAKLEVLSGRQIGRVDADGKEIPKGELKKKKGKWVELAKGHPRLEREFAAPGDDTCYTSCLPALKAAFEKIKSDGWLNSSKHGCQP
jgi:CRISPR-associated endonuclease Csn1